MKKIKRLRESSNLNKGVTLIALIITIIVLLILAGITLAMVVGDNGIIAKAGTAKKVTNESQNAELNQLGDYENKIDDFSLPRTGNNDWIFLKSVQGTEEIDLPSSYSEIYILVRKKDNGQGYSLRTSTTIPYGVINTIDGASLINRYFLPWMGGNNICYDISPTKLKLAYCYIDNVNNASVAYTDVYYRP